MINRMMNSNCKVKIKRLLNGVFAKYQPEVGKVYEASYKEPCTDDRRKSGPICVICVSGKYITLRKGEYDLLEATAV